jgi:2-desacetyl-2-hydroxyethyl bacteriochlorophyllide A dehydrogenase
MTTSHALSATVLGPSRLAVAATPVEHPGPGELLLAPDAVGVCATDVELYDGSMPYLTNGFASYPLVPGHEWTGRVVAVGAGVEGFAEGDRVVGECSIGCGACPRCAAGDYHLCPRRSETGIFGQAGGMQERLRFPATSAHRVPPAVSAEDAAMVEASAIAYRALDRTGAAAGDEVLVVGAGTIGLLCAMLGRARGMRVALVEIDDDRAAFARSLGFEVAPADRTGAPFVVEASGSAGGRRDAVRRCDAGGVVALVGFSGAVGELDLDDVVVRDVTLRGSLGSPGVWPEVIRLLAAGAVRPSVLVTHEFPLEAAEEVFRLAAARRPGVRKILVRPNRREGAAGV